MSFKTINNSVGLHGLVFMLLIIGIYPKMTELDVVSPFFSQSSMIMKKVIDEIRKYITLKQVNNALGTRDRLSIVFMYNLLINLLVLIYWENNTDQSKK